MDRCCLRMAIKTGPYRSHFGCRNRYPRPSALVLPRLVNLGYNMLQLRNQAHGATIVSSGSVIQELKRRYTYTFAKNIQDSLDSFRFLRFVIASFLHFYQTPRNCPTSWPKERSILRFPCLAQRDGPVGGTMSPEIEVQLMDQHQSISHSCNMKGVI